MSEPRGAHTVTPRLGARRLSVRGERTLGLGSAHSFEASGRCKFTRSICSRCIWSYRSETDTALRARQHAAGWPLPQGTVSRTVVRHWNATRSWGSTRSTHSVLLLSLVGAAT